MPDSVSSRYTLSCQPTTASCNVTRGISLLLMPPREPDHPIAILAETLGYKPQTLEARTRWPRPPAAPS
jgi:hypothetical protein